MQKVAMVNPTLEDVAAIAGVSPTTVSRVLNNRGYLSEKTKQKVFAAMQELDYRPNAIARSLQNKKTKIVALIFPTVAHPFYGAMATYLEERLSNRGYRVILCNSQDHPERERDYIDMLLSHHVDGVITGAHSDAIANYPTLRSALVTIDREQSQRYPNIRCDNYGGARKATSALIDAGAHHIVHITSTRSDTNQRQRGYLDVMQENNLEPRILEVGFAAESAAKNRAITDYLDQHPEVDAVFGSNDTYAAYALNWAQVQEKKVPQDFQVVGFDGTQAIHSLLPHLATVVQPIEDMAERAVERLVEAMESSTPHEVMADESRLENDVFPTVFRPGTTVRLP